MVSAGKISIVVSQVGICTTLLCVMLEVVPTRTTDCSKTCEDLPPGLVNCQNRCLLHAQQACKTSTSIDHRDGNLSVLSEGCFKGYRRLSILSLVHNTISNITRGAFQDCDSLIKIYLPNNLLETLEEGVFQGAGLLQELDLSDNIIAYVHSDALRGLGVLTYFNIYANSIGSLSMTTFQHTPSLKILDLGNNLLSYLPAGIFNGLTELIFLNLKNNKLGVLDGSLFDGLENLAKLDLSGNLLVSVSDFPDLPKLAKLKLYSNKLQRIGNLSMEGLENLYFGGNNWTCTCSMSPIREWILYHQKESEVNMICQRPPHLHGQNLASISEVDLCRPELLTTLLPSSTSTEQEVLMATFPSSKTNSPVAEWYSSIDWSLDNPSEDAGLSDEFIYVIAGGATFSFIALVFCIFVKCLAHRSRMYLQQAQSGGRQQNLPMRQRQIPVDENRNQAEDSYSQVGQYSSSSSAGDLSPACLQELPYLVPNISSDPLAASLRHDQPPPLSPREDSVPIAWVQRGTTLPLSVVSECLRAPRTVEASYMYQDFHTTTQGRSVHDNPNPGRRPLPDASWITSELRPWETTQNTPNLIHHTYMSHITQPRGLRD